MQPVLVLTPVLVLVPLLVPIPVLVLQPTVGVHVLVLTRVPILVPLFVSCVLVLVGQGGIAVGIVAVAEVHPAAAPSPT